MIINYAKLSAKELMLINVNDAAKKCIATSDVARDFIDRGKFWLARLRSLSVKARYDPEALGEKGLCKHGYANVLTHDKGTSSR